MRLDELHEASYRGAFFLVTSSELAGGRKDSKKEFINSDLQVIEDLGLKQRIFTVNGIISSRFDTNGKVTQPYLQIRNALIRALELGGKGVLIHPWYGRLDNIVCRTFSLNEDLSRLGTGEINIVFEVSNSDGVPKPNKFVLSKVTSDHKTVLAASKSALKAIWGITEIATGNFEAGFEKITSFISSVNKATSPIAALSEQINKHSSLMVNTSSKSLSLVNSSSSLADSVDNVMGSMNTLYSTPERTLSAFTNLFNFGDNDIKQPYMTVIAAERKHNNDAMNASVQSNALSYSYLNASKIEYQTVDEITEIEQILENQYQKLFANQDMDPDLINSLTELRTTTQEFFAEQKLRSSNVILVNTNPISTRSLAFNYYGSSDLGEDIAELNSLYDSAFHHGDIRIFTT